MTTYPVTPTPPAATNHPRAGSLQLQAGREWIAAAEASGDLEALASARRIYAAMTGNGPAATDADLAAFRAFRDA